MKKKGFILVSVIIMMIVATIIIEVVITKIQNNLNLTVMNMEKLTLQKRAGDAFITIYTYFRNQYREHYIFNLDDFYQSATPTWFNDFRNKIAGGDSPESKAWNKVISSFNRPFYTPKSSFQDLLKSVSGNNIQVVLTPLNSYNNLLFVVVRVHSSRQSAYFSGFVSPKYFTNWAVFALEGVNGYYAYGEKIDGPSYFGGNLGIMSKNPPLTASNGPSFIGFTQYGKLSQLFSETHLPKDLPSNDNQGSKVEVWLNGNYLGKGWYYYSSSNSVNLWKTGEINTFEEQRRLIKDDKSMLIDVSAVDKFNSDHTQIWVRGRLFDLKNDPLSLIFQGGYEELTSSQITDMKNYFDSMNNIYQNQVKAMTRPASEIFLKYINNQPLTDSSSGVYLSDFTWNDGTYDYDEKAKNITVITDVMKANVAANTYNVTLPSTFATPGELVQVTEIKWLEKTYKMFWWGKHYIGNRYVAQVIVTPVTSLKNNKPPWNSMTFFVYYQGTGERKLMFPDIGAVPYNFNGVISAYGNVEMGGEGIPGGKGDQGSQQVSTLYGKYTIISKTGDVKIKGNIIYGGLYDDLKGHLGHSLLSDGIDLNELVKKDKINSMLNLVSLGGSIYIPKENPQPKNPIITANLLTFGSGDYNGDFNNKRGHLWIQNFSSMNNEGYRQIFGSIVTRKMDPTFTGGETNWRGYKEYNVYDRRLYVNEDLPLATPQTNDVIYFGTRMM
jgi:hypothetical protein